MSEGLALNSSGLSAQWCPYRSMYMKGPLILLCRRLALQLADSMTERQLEHECSGLIVIEL